MTLFFDPETNGFYDSKIHGSNIPETAQEITTEKHQEMLAAQRDGKQIQSAADGLPVAVEQYDEWDGSEWTYSIQLEIAAALPAVISAINAACKAEIEGGFISNALGQDHTYDSELEDQVNISGQVQLATDVIHKCIDNADVVDYRAHTATEMHQVGVDLASHKLTQLVKAKGLKDAAAAAAAVDDLATLQAITWS